MLVAAQPRRDLWLRARGNRARGSSSGSEREPTGSEATSGRSSGADKRAGSRWGVARKVTEALDVVVHWKATVEAGSGLGDLASLRSLEAKPHTHALCAERRASSGTSVASAAPVLPLAQKARGRGAAAQLYEEGKSLYAAGSFESAQAHFELCAETLERGPAQVESYRHLGEYAENCRIMIERDKKLSCLSGARSAAGTGSSGTPACELLIFACSPTLGPALSVDSEVTEVLIEFPGCPPKGYGGTPDDLREQLERKRPKRFHFAGHADVAVHGLKNKTLGFTGPAGELQIVDSESLAAMLGSSVPAKGGRLEFVFLNGCRSYELGLKLIERGVAVVVCWRTKAHDAASRMFAAQFYSTLERTDDYAKAFEQATHKVKMATRPVLQPNGKPSGLHVQQFALVGPEQTLPPDLAALQPPPIPAGVPELLVAGGGAGARA